MPTITEDQLSAWTSKAFNNEDEKAKNTEAMIRAAIDADRLLASLSIEVYAKGSYKNNTNVRRDSDVDIAVEYHGMITPIYGPRTDSQEVRRVRGTSPYSGPFRDSAGHADIGMFKEAVGRALVAAFGEGAVTRHNKVFTVRESSRSLAADVVPCNTYRRYFSPQNFRQGIRLIPDRDPGFTVVNYPQPHYENGVAKNKATTMRFKPLVRILKNLENKMVAERTSLEVASYLIECLVYNAPRASFEKATWAARTRSVLAHIWEDTEDAECETRWYEVNGYKYLFHTHQRWTRGEARDFVHAAWQYVKDS